MRVALVVPDPRDPAHAAVRAGLGRALRARGHRLTKPDSADVVHVHLFSRRWGRLRGLRTARSAALVVTLQGADPALTSDRRALAGWIKRADAVTVVSRASRRSFPGAAQAAVVFNGAAAPAARRARRGPDILTVGRLAAYKGLDLLAVALAGEPGLRWTAVGPDQTAGRFARFVRRLGWGTRARLAGTLPPARVRALMASCRVFVQPSRAEGLPMALLEAMAAGAPCVASEAGGSPEALGRAGVLVPSGSPEGLRRAVGCLLRDSLRARRLGSAARRRAGLFTWDRAAKSYERLYARARRGKSQALVLDSRAQSPYTGT